MIESLLRLLALRPLLTIAIMGIPLLVLIVIGLAAIMLFKLLLFVVLPVAIGVWLLRRIFRGRPARSHEPVAEPVASV